MITAVTSNNVRFRLEDILCVTFERNGYKDIVAAEVVLAKNGVEKTVRVNEKGVLSLLENWD